MPSTCFYQNMFHSFALAYVSTYAVCLRKNMVSNEFLSSNSTGRRIILRRLSNTNGPEY